MIYVDYDYYKNEYKGVQIKESDFERFALRASEQVDFVTYNKAEKYYALDPISIKKTVCNIAEIIAEAERSNPSLQENQAGTGIIKSESVGKQSFTYETFNSHSTEGQKLIQNRINKALNHYLFATGLLYRGVALC